jgi:hypothetical protein
MSGRRRPDAKFCSANCRKRHQRTRQAVEREGTNALLIVMRLEHYLIASDHMVTAWREIQKLQSTINEIAAEHEARNPRLL